MDKAIYYNYISTPNWDEYNEYYKGLTEVKAYYDARGYETQLTEESRSFDYHDHATTYYTATLAVYPIEVTSAHHDS